MKEKAIQTERRKVIKTIGAVGLAGATLNSLTTTASGKSSSPPDRVSIPMRHEHNNHEEMLEGAEPERKTIYQDIPYRDWVRNKSRADAAERVLNRIDAKYGGDFYAVGVTRSVESQSSTSIVEIDFYEDQTNITYDEFSDAVPASINGQAGKGENAETVEDIPVKIRKESANWTFYDYTYTPMPGGCASEYTKTGGIFTICSPCYSYSSGQYHLLHHGHTLDEAIDIDQYKSSKAGYTWDVLATDKKGFDAGHSNIYDADRDYIYKIAEDSKDSYKSGDIGGVWAADNIENRANDSDGRDMSQQGFRTGFDRDEITKVYYEDIDNDGSAEPVKFRSKVDVGTGDSGGPHYDSPVGGSGQYIGGIQSVEFSDGDAGATIAATAENVLDVTI